MKSRGDEEEAVHPQWHRACSGLAGALSVLLFKDQRRKEKARQKNLKKKKAKKKK